MVSKASEDLPEPARPVKTTSLSRGMATSMFLRLCSRAPRMVICRKSRSDRLGCSAIESVWALEGKNTQPDPRDTGPARGCPWERSKNRLNLPVARPELAALTALYTAVEPGWRQLHHLRKLTRT